MKAVEKAGIKDATAIHQMVNYFADRGEMLPRSLSEIYEDIRNYFVVRQDERVIACAALHVSWEDLAEIKSLAVSDEQQGKGFGAKLVEACLKDARSLGIKRVFALSYVPDFFIKLGFKEVEKAILPHKIWADCLKCPKFPDCDETALMMDI